MLKTRKHLGYIIQIITKAADSHNHRAALNLCFIDTFHPASIRAPRWHRSPGLSTIDALTCRETGLVRLGMPRGGLEAIDDVCAQGPDHVRRADEPCAAGAVSQLRAGKHDRGWRVARTWE